MKQQYFVFSPFLPLWFHQKWREHLCELTSISVCYQLSFLWRDRRKSKLQLELYLSQGFSETWMAVTWFIKYIPLPAYKLSALLYLSFQHCPNSLPAEGEDWQIGGGTDTTFQDRFLSSQDFVPNSFLVSEALKCWAFKPVNGKNNLLVPLAQTEICSAGLFLHMLSGKERCPPIVTSSFGFWGDCT